MGLGWTAGLTEHNIGKRIRDFKMGFKPLPDAKKKSLLGLLLTPNGGNNVSTRHRTNQGNDGSQHLLSSEPSFHEDDAKSSKESVRAGGPVASSAPVVSGDPRPGPADGDPASQSAAGLRGAVKAPAVKAPAVNDPFAPPVEYDARDTLPGQLQCVSFQPLDQFGCDSCYAFGVVTSYSARVCVNNRNSLGNIVISPQQIINCNGGCGGSDEISVFESLITRPPVEQWCDPYDGVPRPCESSPACHTSRTFPALAGALRVVGNGSPAGLRWMMLEIMRGGPGTLTLVVFNDLFGYVSGVYTVSPGATYAGTHAVGVVGWGTDPAGGPYWLIQNSWGAGFGEAGYFRIRRGTDESGIEHSGLILPVPAPLTQCLSANCPDRAITLADCTCQCRESFAGPNCDQCPIQCANGGDLGGGCTACSCPLGFRGARCEWGVRLGPLATCAGDAAAVVLANVSYGDAIPPPAGSSFLGVFPLDEMNPYALDPGSRAYLCGDGYDALSNGGLCPAADVQVELALPTDPGQYKVVLVPFVPADPAIYAAYGLVGWSAPLPRPPAATRARRRAPCTRPDGPRAVSTPSRGLSRRAARSAGADSGIPRAARRAGTIRWTTARPWGTSPCWTQRTAPTRPWRSRRRPSTPSPPSGLASRRRRRPRNSTRSR